MGDSGKRCEECKKPIDEGKLCVNCRPVKFNSDLRFSPSELRDMKDRSTSFQSYHNDQVKSFNENESSMPPSSTIVTKNY